MFILLYVLLSVNLMCIVCKIDDIQYKKEKTKLTDAELNLLAAATQGNAVEAEKALRAGAYVDTRDGDIGNTAFIWAASLGFIDIMNLLLKKGADIDALSYDGHKTALLLASYSGKIGTVEYLLSRGAGINAKNDRGDNVLHISAYRGYLDVSDLLVTRSVSLSLDVTHKHLYSPLHLASYKGYYEITELLLQKGDTRSYHLIDKGGNSAIMLSAMMGHKSTMRLIYQFIQSLDGVDKIDIEAVDNMGNTALMLAANNGHVDCVNWLTDIGAQVNTFNHNKQTPLMRAASKGFTEVALVLLSSGADATMMDNSDMTALTYAKDETMKALLRSASKSEGNQDFIEL